MSEPVLIQGGMGVGVSNWRLARAVSREGHLGVVSGTAVDRVFVCRLQEGDPGGHVRRALAHFPSAELAEELLSRYYIPGGKNKNQPYVTQPLFRLKSDRHLLGLAAAANFCEVFLAKEGHDGLVGINYLEKIQLPTLPSLYGAMLAGVDYVLMGAGIPRTIPGILDGLAEHKPVALKIKVDGATPEDNFETTLDPALLIPDPPSPLKRPKFIGIVASAVLAQTLAKKSTGRVDGFVIENYTAGGHNAPPRGTLKLTEDGEPVYGPRDDVDPAEIKKLGLPFWLAGCYNSPEKLQEALSQGACGIQTGTIFAFCRESGLTDEVKRQVIQKSREGDLSVFTDPLASPTGFPFKVVRLNGSLSEEDEYARRPRVCDLGYLRSVYKKADGSVGYRCPGEPVELDLAKGGRLQETVGRKCLCNGLLANIGFPQVRSCGYVEGMLITSGIEILQIANIVKNGCNSYSAIEVINYLLGKTTADEPHFSESTTSYMSGRH
jgi:nitronate monooxygenase